VVTDLIQIRRLGEKKRPENERLRRHMKRFEFVERRLRRIAEEIEDAIDCTECASCCRVATVRLQERDIDKLARALRLNRDRFLHLYTEETEEEGRIIKRNPDGCPFLVGNLCSVYDDRPSTCQDFPHLVRGAGSLVSRMWQMADRACYCPIAYNTLEAFKVETKFFAKSG
jgi:uncharacterized protein